MINPNRCWYQPKVSLFPYVLGWLLFVIVTGEFSWAALECGDVIAQNEVVTLTQDLTCSGPGAPALILESSSTLNLGGHTVDCVNHARSGIIVLGSGATLQQGTVTNCTFGVSLLGAGKHRVKAINSTQHSFMGFATSQGSHGNRLTHSKANRNTMFGILIGTDSNENEVSFSQAIDNNAGFVVARGNRNTIRNNLAQDNLGNGIFVEGNDNSVVKNKAIANDKIEGVGGIMVLGSRNRVLKNFSHNTIRGSGILVQGNEMLLLWNRTTGNFQNGLHLLLGSENWVLGNLANRNQKNGIRLDEGAIDSTILGNLALSNKADDLSDGNSDCDNNTWRLNRFKTTNQPNCIR